MIKLLHESSNIYVIFALVVYNILNTLLMAIYGRCLFGTVVFEQLVISMIILHIGNDLIVYGIRFIYTLRLMYKKKTKEKE